MNNNTYPNRLSPFLYRGITTGALYGLLSPLLYVVLMVIVMFVLPFLPPSNPYYDESFMVSNFIMAVIFWGIPSVVPATIIGLVDGAIVAVLLATWKDNPGNRRAALVGFAAGTALVILINYLVWHNLHINRQAYYPFWHFLYPVGMDLAHFTTSRNLYYLHSLIAVFLSTFGAWQINRKVLSEQNSG